MKAVGGCSRSKTQDIRKLRRAGKVMHAFSSPGGATVHSRARSPWETIDMFKNPQPRRVTNDQQRPPIERSPFGAAKI